MLADLERVLATALFTDTSARPRRLPHLEMSYAEDVVGATRAKLCANSR
jgi:hypothetical protein